jgi:hypothetical protein
MNFIVQRHCDILTVEAPGTHAAKLDDVEDGAGGDTLDVLGRIGGDEHLGSNSVADAVSDEEHGCGDGLLGSASDVGGEESPDH